LQYMIAAALCDGELTPAQYAPQRILAPDVQSLLRRVTVRPQAEFSARFPAEMPCRVAITLWDGRRFEIKKRDYEGFYTRPMSYETIALKFHNLAAPFASSDVREAIVETVSRLGELKVRSLSALLADLQRGAGGVATNRRIG